jgi:hypothetical protein
MATGELLQLTRRRIRHLFIIFPVVCIRNVFITLDVAVDFMNVQFLIMHQISTRDKRYNTFSGGLNTLVKFNCKIFICFQSDYSLLLVSLLTY